MKNFILDEYTIHSFNDFFFVRIPSVVIYHKLPINLSLLLVFTVYLLESLFLFIINFPSHYSFDLILMSEGLKQCAAIDALMIIDLDGTAIEAELLLADAMHEVAALGPLDEPPAPGALFEALLQHLFFMLGFFHFINYFVVSTTNEGMRWGVARETDVFVALLTLKVFVIFIIKITILWLLV
jgi:hypothetical protein